MAARRTVEWASGLAVMYYMMARSALWMIIGPSVLHLFGNSWSRPESNPRTAPTTGPPCGNVLPLPTLTCHHGRSCYCMPSLNDSDGRPNTPPHNSPLAAHHRVAIVRQLAIRPPERESEEPWRSSSPS